MKSGPGRLDQVYTMRLKNYRKHIHVRTKNGLQNVQVHAGLAINIVTMGVSTEKQS